MARTFQDGGRLVVFIFIIARQRSSDGRQVRLIGTRPKASRAIEFTINRPTTNIYTVEQAKFASAIISRIRELASPSRSYRTGSIGCLVTLSTTGGDGASVGEFHP